MPRRARLSVPGIPWHIIQRGNNRTPCFYDDSDYRVYLDHLGEQAEKHGCRVHAYVLMTNHVHLLVTPAAGHTGMGRQRRVIDETSGPAVRPVR